MACALFSSSPHRLAAPMPPCMPGLSATATSSAGLGESCRWKTGSAQIWQCVHRGAGAHRYRTGAKQKLFANPYRKESEMEPKFVDLPAFTLVGLCYYGKNEHQEISALWGEFNEHSGAIRHVTANTPAYGLCTGDRKAANGEFEYVAAFQVDQAADIPEGMVVRQVPQPIMPSLRMSAR